MFNFVDPVFVCWKANPSIYLQSLFSRFLLLKELYPTRAETLTAKAYDINVLLCCSNDQRDVLKAFCLVSPVVFAVCVDLVVSYVFNKLLNPKYFLVVKKKGCFVYRATKIKDQGLSETGACS